VDDPLDPDALRVTMAVHEDRVPNDDYGRLEICLNLLLKRQGKDDPEKWDPDRVSPFDVIFEQVWEETIGILNGRWPVVEAIVAALLEDGMLAGGQMVEIFKAAETT